MTALLLDFLLLVSVSGGRVSIVGAIPASASPALPATFVPNGPAPILEPGDNTPVKSGAISALVLDPAEPSTAWAASVGGGVWKTTTFHAGEPKWKPLTDHMASLSIAALALDPTVPADPNDPTRRTLVAGTGSSSSYPGKGGPLVGLLRTTDAGATWAPLGTGDLAGKSVIGVAPRGDVIVAAEGKDGLWRSIDGGETFTPQSGRPVIKDHPDMVFPVGPAMSLVGDPARPDRLYAAIAGPGGGVFRSDDRGERWTPEGRVEFGAEAANAARFVLAVGSYAGGAATVVYGAIVDKDTNGRLLLRSGDAGDHWTAFAAPAGPTDFGEETFVAVAADPATPAIFYLAGVSHTSRCTVDTASGLLLPPCVLIEYGGTAINTAPHGDVRKLLFDGPDILVQTDDGGIYQRTKPRDDNGLGDWTSKNGDLAVNEPYSCGYDDLFHTAICGTQDNGTNMAPSPGALTWTRKLGADGGIVGVFNPHGPCTICSTRYYSKQRLEDFTRDDCLQDTTCNPPYKPSLIIDGTGTSLPCGKFPDPCPDPSISGEENPMAVDRFDGARLVIASKTVYESKNGGDTLVKQPGFTGQATRAVAFGGRSAGVDNPSLLYVGGSDGLFLRTTDAGALVPTGYQVGTQGQPQRLSLDPDDWHSAWVITDKHTVWHGTRVGLVDETWTDLTGDLHPGGPSARELRSVAFVPGAGASILAVGADDGLYVTDTNALGHWSKLAGDLPNAIVDDLTYDRTDDVLLVATLGRSTWLVPDASQMRLPPVVDASLSDNSGGFNDATTLLARLTDGNTGAPVAGKVMHFSLGNQSCDGTTDGSGVARCTLVIAQDVGAYTVKASTNADAGYDTRPYTVIQEDTSTRYTGATTGDFHDPAVVSARLVDPSDGTPVAHQTITFRIGSSATDVCSDKTNLAGFAACSITPTQQPGPYPVTAAFAGPGNYAASGDATMFTVSREETVTSYTGDTYLANGTAAVLSAVLSEDGTNPLGGGRPVLFTLGSGAGAQTCAGATEANGVATCTIPVVSQPGGSTSVPVTARFVGDSFYRPSAATVTLVLEYMTGRSFGTSARIGTILGSVNVLAIPDTGEVSTADASTTSTPCTVSIAGVVTSRTLCAKVTTRLAPGGSTATASAELVTVNTGIPGVPVVQATLVRAASTTTCAGSSGATTIGSLTVGGTAQAVSSIGPNSVVSAGPLARLVLNEQKPVPGGLTVNAIHLTVPVIGLMAAEVIVGSATSDIHNCPPPP